MAEAEPAAIETVATRGVELVCERAGEGTPIDDHRASAAYRAAMLGQSLRKLYAESPEEVPA